MNLRDREFPDRRGARREAAPRSGRAAPAFVPSTRALQSGAWNGGRGHRGRAPPTRRHLPMQVLKGQAVSAGIAIGPVVVLDPRGMRLPPRSIAPQAIPAELERLDRGLDAAQDAASHDETEARTRLGPQYADILAAHCRMIADPTLRADARKIIEARACLRGARRSRCAREARRPGWNGSPARTCRLGPPMSATSRPGS